MSSSRLTFSPAISPLFNVIVFFSFVDIVSRDTRDTNEVVAMLGMAKLGPGEEKSAAPAPPELKSVSISEKLPKSVGSIKHEFVNHNSISHFFGEKTNQNIRCMRYKYPYLLLSTCMVYYMQSYLVKRQKQKSSLYMQNCPHTKSCHRG